MATRRERIELTAEKKIADDHDHGESVEEDGPTPIDAPTIRSTLGFLAARRRLTLPDVGLDEEEETTGHLAALAVVDRFGFVLLSCASGILVYATEALKAAAFGEHDAGDVPVHTDVKLGGRPSCMTVSHDNLRVAVALEDKVLIFDMAALASGSPDPDEELKLPADDRGVCEPPHALSWGREAGGDGPHLLLIVGADRSAAIARVGATEEGDRADLVMEPVANGERVFVSGCWLWRGMGRFALGTVAGCVEVYRESDLQSPIGSALPPVEELDLSPKAEVNHLSVMHTGGSLLAVYYDRTAENNDAARIAEFVVPEFSSSADPVLRSFEAPDSELTPMPSFDAPQSCEFRCHVAHVELEGEDAVVITHSLNDLYPAVLASDTRGKGRWKAFELDEGWDFGLEGFPRGLCVSDCLDDPVPPQRKNQSAFGSAPLLFALNSMGELWCTALVQPQLPETVTRRRTARTAQSIEELESGATGAVAGEDGEDDEETEEEEGVVEDEEGEKREESNVETSAPKIHSNVMFGGGKTAPPLFGASTTKDGAVSAAFGFGFGAGGSKPPSSSSIFSPPHGKKGAAGSFLTPFTPYVPGSTAAPAPASNPWGAGSSSFAKPSSSSSNSPTFSAFGSSFTAKPGSAERSTSPFGGGSGGSFKGFGALSTGGNMFGGGGSTTPKAAAGTEVKAEKAAPAGGSAQFKSSASCKVAPPSDNSGGMTKVGATKSVASGSGPDSKPTTGIKPPSASRFPPTSSKAPKPFGEPTAASASTASAAKLTSGSGYPPLAMKAPAVFGGKTETSAASPAGKPAVASFGFAQPSTKGASIFRTTPAPAPSVAAGAVSGSSVPTSAKDGAKQESSSFASSASPLSGEALSVFRPKSPASAPTSASAGAKPFVASAFPPISRNAPAVFGEPKKTGAGSSGIGTTKPATPAGTFGQKPATPAAAPAAVSSEKAASAYPPISRNAPAVFGEPKKTGAGSSGISFGTTKPATPAGTFGQKPATPAAAPAAVSSEKAASAYPPISRNAPAVFGEPKKTGAGSSGISFGTTKPATPAGTFGQKPATPAAAPAAVSSEKAASAYPPISRNAPAVFGEPKKTGAGSSGISFGTTKPETPAGTFGQKPATPAVAPAAVSSEKAASAYPPISRNAPGVFGEPKKTGAGSSGISFGTTKPATPAGTFGQKPATPAAAPTAGTSGKAASAYPPISRNAPGVFGEPKKVDAGSSGISFGTTKPATPAGTFGQKPATPAAAPTAGTSGKTSSAYPPISRNAPGVFGEPTKAGAGSSGISFGTTKPATPAGTFGQKPATPAAAPTAGTSGKASSAYPPISRNAPGVFGEPTKAGAGSSGISFGTTKPATPAGTFGQKPATPAAAPTAGTSGKASSAYPPISRNAPGVFGEPTKAGVGSSLGSTKPAAPAGMFGKKLATPAPAAFGEPKKAEAGSLGISFGTTKPATPAGTFGQKSVPHAAASGKALSISSPIAGSATANKISASSSSAYPIMSTKAPSEFSGDKKPPTSSVFVPTSAAASAAITAPSAFNAPAKAISTDAPANGAGSGLTSAFPSLSVDRTSVFGAPTPAAQPSGLFGASPKPFGEVKPAEAAGADSLTSTFTSTNLLSSQSNPNLKPTFGGGFTAFSSSAATTTAVAAASPAVNQVAAERDSQKLPSAETVRVFSAGGGGVDAGTVEERKTPTRVSRSEALPAARGKYERRHDYGDDDYEDYDREEMNGGEFCVPKIPEFKTPRRSGTGVRWSDDDLSVYRKVAASSGPEGLAWKTVVDMVGLLRDLKEMGEAGPLRDKEWTGGMAQGVARLRSAIRRLREIVGELGRGMAAQVTELGTLKANYEDIKWQVRVAKACVDNGEEEEGGDQELASDDGREPLPNDMIQLRKSTRANRKIIEAVMADLMTTLKSRRERRADLDIRAAAAVRAITVRSPQQSPSTLAASRRQQGSVARSAQRQVNGVSPQPKPRAGGGHLRGGAIHGVLPKARLGASRARDGGVGQGVKDVGRNTSAASPTPYTATPERAPSSTASHLKSPFGAAVTPPASTSLGSVGSALVLARGGGSDGLRASRRSRNGDEGTSGWSSGARTVVERPGLRLLRVVGAQYNATLSVEELVVKAEKRVEELEHEVSEITAAEEADDPTMSTALVLKDREDSLSRGQRIRREQAGVLVFAKQASKLSGTFKLHEACKIETFTKDQLAEHFGDKPAIAMTPKKTPSGLYTDGRGPGSVHQPSSASRASFPTCPPDRTGGSSSKSGATSTQRQQQPMTPSRPSAPVFTAVAPSPAKAIVAVAAAPSAATRSVPSVVGGGLISKQASVTVGTASGSSSSASASSSRKDKSLWKPAKVSGGAGATSALQAGSVKTHPGTAGSKSAGASAYPPLPKAAPAVFGEEGGGAAGPQKAAASARDPAAESAAKAVAAAGGPTRKPLAGKAAASGFPPMAKLAPNVFGDSGGSPSTIPLAKTVDKRKEDKPKAEVNAAPAAKVTGNGAAPLPSPFGPGVGFGVTKPSPFGVGASLGSGSSSANATAASSAAASQAPAATTTVASPTPTSGPGFAGLSALSSAATSVAPAAAPQQPAFASVGASKASGTMAPPSSGSGAFSMTGFEAALGVAPAASAGAGAGTVVTTGAGGSGTPDYRQQVLDIYNKYNKEKLSEVDAILTKYRGKEEILIAKLRKKYEQSRPSATAPMPATAPAPTPTFPIGNTINASAGVPGGIFPPPATSSSPFGNGVGFGAPKPPGIGGGVPVFGQSPTAPTCFGTNTASASTPSPFRGGGTQTTNPAPSAPIFGVAPSPIGMQQQQQQQQQASPFAAPPSGRGDPALLKAWLTEVYSRFKPDNVQKIDKLMTKYMNNEWKMIEQIVKKYGQHGVNAPPGWSTSPPSSSPVPTGFGQTTPAFGKTSPAFGQASGMGMGFGGGQTQQASPFGGTNAFGSSVGAPAPSPSPFGGGTSGFGAPSPLGGVGVFGTTAPSATVPSKGGFGAFATGGAQPTFGSAGAGAGGGFGAFASQTKTSGFGAVAGSGGGFGGPSSSSKSSGGFTGSSFREFRG